MAVSRINNPGVGRKTSRIMDALIASTDGIVDEAALVAALDGEEAWGTHSFYTAIRRMERMHGQVWRPAGRGVRSLVRQGNEGIVIDIDARQRRIRRAAKRIVVVGSAADQAAMSQSERTSLAMRMAVAATVANTTDSAVAKAIAGRETKALGFADIVAGLAAKQ